MKQQNLNNFFNHFSEKVTSSKIKENVKTALVLLLIGGVIYFFISKSSFKKEAFEKIDMAKTIPEIHQIYDEYKFKITESDPERKGKKRVSHEFELAIKEKLKRLNPNETQLKEILKWLPQSQQSLNVVIIPDLSRRIIDVANNGNQIANDAQILDHLWQSFSKIVKLKINSKDRFMIDATDPEQAQNQFSQIANLLNFDLSHHKKGQSNRLFFTIDKDKQFQENVQKLYQIAQNKPLGADYLYYFKRHLNDRIQKNTLHQSYKNKVVIITDGYMEREGSPADTKLLPLLIQASNTGNSDAIKEKLNTHQLNLPNFGLDLSNTEILICEVNERKSGQGRDFEILKAYWENWLSAMHVKHVQFVAKEDAINITLDKLDEFLER